jgi:hypothetical protein
MDRLQMRKCWAFYIATARITHVDKPFEQKLGM